MKPESKRKLVNFQPVSEKQCKMSKNVERFCNWNPKNTMLENPNHFEIQGFEGKFQIENPDQKPNF